MKPTLVGLLNGNLARAGALARNLCPPVELVVCIPTVLGLGSLVVILLLLVIIADLSVVLVEIVLVTLVVTVVVIVVVVVGLISVMLDVSMMGVVSFRSISVLRMLSTASFSSTGISPVASESSDIS